MVVPLDIRSAAVLFEEAKHGIGELEDGLVRLGLQRHLHQPVEAAKGHRHHGGMRRAQKVWKRTIDGKLSPGQSA